MKNSKTVLQEVIGQIRVRENSHEIRNMALILLENVLGFSPTDVMAGKIVRVTSAMSDKLDAFVKRLNKNEPVQYIMGESFFYSRKFKVNTSVLIPRPETEELVRCVIEWGNKFAPVMPRLLDIGTGSGCISVTLALEFQGADVFALDISTDALAVAQANADMHGVKVKFFTHDILNGDLTLRDLDIIVSNPPYVSGQEKDQMKSNVLDYEPHDALFAPDTDPLLFYRRIVGQAEVALRGSGLLAVEINERFGHEVLGLFLKCGFQDVRLTPDIAGKHRIVRGIKGIR